MIKKFKLFEATKNTPQEILDLFNDRIKSYDFGKFKISVQRIEHSYKVIAIDKTTNKSVGRIYIRNIKKVGDKYTALIARLHVSDNYRGEGLGDELLRTTLETFSDVELYGYASPNRNKDMKDDERDEYRNKLFNFYSRYGLKRVSDKNHKIVRPIKE